MKRILVMCPSRSANGKRIQNLKELYQSWKDTTSGHSDFLVGIDENDKHFYPDFKEAVVDVNSEQLKVVRKINYLAEKYVHKYDFVQFIGDDCLFMTKGWEETFLEEATGNDYVMFYPDDTIQGEKLCTHPFMSTNIVKKLGFMGPTCLEHMYVDNFWKSVGEYLGCLRYFPNIVINHRHPAKGFATDEVYESSKSGFHQDGARYVEYMQTQFLNDMKKFT